MSDKEVAKSAPDRPIIPVEIEIYLNPDGSVTFADLEEQAITIARELDPDATLACDVPAAKPDTEADPARSQQAPTE